MVAEKLRKHAFHFVFYPPFPFLTMLCITHFNHPLAHMGLTEPQMREQDF